MMADFRRNLYGLTRNCIVVYVWCAYIRFIKEKGEDNSITHYHPAHQQNELDLLSPIKDKFCIPSLLRNTSEYFVKCHCFTD
jgi:hypothetical protein